MRLIDADKLECVSATMPHETSDDYKEGYGDGMNYVLDIIDDLPTIDPVKHGRWEEVTNKWGALEIRCSECGAEVPLDGWGNALWAHYCPNCGAYMQEGEG